MSENDDNEIRASLLELIYIEVKCLESEGIDDIKMPKSNESLDILLNIHIMCKEKIDKIYE